MRNLILLGIGLVMASFAQAQVKKIEKAEKKVPDRIERLPVKPGIRWVAPRPTTPVLQQKKQRVITAQLPATMRAETISFGYSSRNTHRNIAGVKPITYTRYRPINNVSTNGATATCDTILLTRQSQIDSFPQLFPGCTTVKILTIDGSQAIPAITRLDSLYPVTKITQDLNVKGTGVTDFSGLSSITDVGSYIWLDSNYNLTSTNWNTLTHTGGFVFTRSPLLTNMDGMFSHLTNTNLWSTLFDNLGLTDFAEFGHVTSVINFSVSNCPVTSLNGFQNLTAADYGMQINSNPFLADISQLSNITKSRTLQFFDDPQLPNLHGIHNITNVEGVVMIVGDDGLLNLNDFNSNLIVYNQADPGDELYLLNNPNLSVCSSLFLCRYLQDGLPAQIGNNAAGCNDIEQVKANCPSNLCGLDSAVWSGANGNSWNDTLNWEGHKVPLTCTKVIIPGSVDNMPNLDNDVVIGGLYMEGANLYLMGHDLTVKNYAFLNGANLNNGNQITLLRVIDPKIYNSNFEAEFKCLDYSGTAEFLSNNFTGSVTLSDSTGRNGSSTAFFNTFNSDLTLINNSEYGQNYLSNASPSADIVYGNLKVINHSSAGISVGLGGGNPIYLQGDALFQNDGGGDIGIRSLTFSGAIDQHLTIISPSEIFIEDLDIVKTSNTELILDQETKILTNLVLHNSGGYIRAAAGKSLILNDGASATDITGVTGSFVIGPVTKIGNTPFTFPIGDKQGSNFYKGPLKIAAPSNVTDAFTAEYQHVNPTAAGYDTSLYSNGFGGISGKEYWKYNRTNGASNVKVTLSYDSTRSVPIYELANAQIVGWNGSQWTSWFNGGFTGHPGNGTITSLTPITTYGPLTLSAKPIRKPVITIGAIDSITCMNRSFMVRFTLDTLMVTGNVFRVQLSDSLGNFSNGFNPTIGQKQTITSDSIPVVFPFNVAAGKPYRIRIVGNLVPDTSTNFPVVRPSRVPQNEFSIVGPDSVCIGTGPAKFYPSVKEAGAAYTWNVQGGTFNQVSDTAFITWTNANSYTITLTSSNACGAGVQHNRFIVVRPGAPVAAPVLTNTGRWLYASSPASNLNVTSYQWFKNGVLISGASSASYYANTIGSFTVRYANSCGNSPASNAITFSTVPQPQIISFTTLSNRVYGDSSFALNVTSSSGLPVITQIISGPGNLTAGIYTITNSGTVVIRASQPGDDNTDTAAFVTQTFVISKAPQTIIFPPIPDHLYGVSLPAFLLQASSNSGLPLNYALNSGPAVVGGAVVTVNGLGNVTVTASQVGDTNYLPASPVTRTFCVRVPALSPIIGAPFACPGQTVSYSVNAVAGLTYSWRLSNGTNYASVTNTSNITWSTPGTYTLIVSATGPCGPATINDSLVVNVINPVTPGAVTNMLPANGSTGLQLPLNLSWQPGANALTYDLYIWDSAVAQPATPFASDITGIVYAVPAGSLTYNKTYNWRVVSKNACLQTNGAIQKFRLRTLPDLVVTEVQAPIAANSGQTITINWKVKNVGPGSTGTNQSWTDAVFLSFDTLPNFNIPPNTTSAAWSQLDFPVRPLLIGAKPNVSALDSGQQYTNSINFTLPLNYSQPLYAYVITSYPAGVNAPLQMTNANDTAKASNFINVSLSPTPDLRVDTVFSPNSLFSGSTVNITYKIKNYGVLTPSGSGWTDKIYLSSSAVFNINNATPLTLPKANGTYYSDVLNAVVNTTVQLQSDSFITKNVSVVIPNFISGTYFIHVVTNTTGSIYEGVLSGNNTNNAVVQVFLTPTPQLTINSITVPFANASITQPIGINWNVFNAGFRDNKEKNKGHYFIPGPCTYNGSPSSGYIDSLGFGGSSWVDRVYLSKDANGLNIGNAILLGEVTQGVPGSGSNSPENLLSTLCNPGSTPPPANVNTTSVLAPGSNHAKQLNVALPANLAAGDYYVYVYTNPTKTVFEYPDTPSIRRSTSAITIQRPDLSVPTVTLPAAVSGAQSFDINYTIQNNGPGAVFGAKRKDRIYISSSPLFDGSAIPVDTVEFTENIATAGSVSHLVSYTFPAGTSGTRYIYVQTNMDSLFRENSYSNNISAGIAIAVSAAIPADLVINNLQVTDSFYSNRNNTIGYTIANNGAATATGSWVDSIWISCNSTFNPATAVFVGLKNQNRTIASGAAVNDSITLNTNFAYVYNNCFPKADQSTFYLFVKTNANNVVYEGAAANNNISSSGAKVFVNSHVDHIVTALSAPDTATVARNFQVSWTVKNIGLNPGGDFYKAWDDGVYFSADSVFNGNAKLATLFFSNSKLNTNETYSETRTATVPVIPTGDYYLWMVTNASKAIAGEINTSNNARLLRLANGTAKKVHVIQPLLPDLADSISSLPATVAVGQPLTIVNRVENKGAGTTYPDSWSNELWLSTDFIPGNNGDTKLTSTSRKGNLLPGGSYSDTIIVQIPLTTPAGNYLLISVADAGNAVVESNDTNNLFVQPVVVYSPSPVDLRVASVTIPDTAYLGYTIDAVNWTISNNSPNQANGISSDGIYLSKNSFLDSTSTLVGIKNKLISMSPLAQDNQNLQPVVTGVTEGKYYVVVKTDLLNNMVETDKNNNTTAASKQIYVKVKPLQLNVTETNTLQSVTRYYKLSIPDSLIGSTILVTLNTNDSLTMRNEMYIGGSYVPTPARFDYRFEIPNYGNQRILMNDVKDSVYYIAIRCVTANPVQQQITLKAVKLPFAILDVQSSSGGNGGNVTVKLTGSLFTNTMIAHLVKSNITIKATNVYFVNSTTVYATFPLQGRSLGVYDVRLTKADLSVATLPASFSIVSPNNGGLITGGGNNTGQNGSGGDAGCDPGAAAGYNSLLLTDLVIPENVFAGWPFSIQITFSNPTNMDIPIPNRVLYNDRDMPMALTQAGLKEGTTSLYLQLSEPGGPPGIIRAGATGSITIYCQAPLNTPGHTLVKFFFR